MLLQTNLNSGGNDKGHHPKSAMIKYTMGMATPVVEMSFEDDGTERHRVSVSVWELLRMLEELVKDLDPKRLANYEAERYAALHKLVADDETLKLCREKFPNANLEQLRNLIPFKG